MTPSCIRQIDRYDAIVPEVVAQDTYPSQKELELSLSRSAQRVRFARPDILFCDAHPTDLYQ
jgi:hypothetical protein